MSKSPATDLSPAEQAAVEASTDYAKARERWQKLDQMKPAEKATRIRVAMQADPKLSYTAAERDIELDPVYAQHLEAMRMAAVDMEMLYAVRVVMHARLQPRYGHEPPHGGDHA